MPVTDSVHRPVPNDTPRNEGHELIPHSSYSGIQFAGCNHDDHDREPFFAAVAEACRRAGAQFWVNVESGECHVADWNEYVEHEKKRIVATAVDQDPWRFTPMDWLEQKLNLAARHGENIVNWGYFPYMDPMANPKRKLPSQIEAYRAYKAYYNRLKQEAP